jgi:L-ascorbate metabolism protein UlaG (beta-lactamase superfamily)
MRKCVFLALLLAVTTIDALAQTCKVEVTYLANEGVMLRAGSQKVVVDGIFRKAMEPYLNHDKDTQKDLEKAKGKFEDVDLILATHHHADHFDEQAVAVHLKSSPLTTFVGSTQMTDKVLTIMGLALSPQVITADPDRRVTIEDDGIAVEVLNVLHSADPSKPMRTDVQHRGYIVHLNGLKILHLGDADGRPENFEPQQFPDDELDVAMIPYWYVLNEKERASIRQHIKTKKLVLIHVPPGDVKRVSDDAKKEFPEAIVLGTPGEKHCY